MKILWLSNVIFPQVCEEIGVPTPFGGGWMESSANSLMCNIKDNFSLAVISKYSGSQLKIIDKFAIKYYLVPDNPKTLCKYFQIVQNDFNPDIVHIHGTEYNHSLEFVNSCGVDNVIVSVQGLISACYEYFYGGIPKRDLPSSIRDIIRFDSLIQQRKNVFFRGESEKLLLNKVKHVIGRTSWDKSRLWELNPNLTYHYCNETLRSGFYNNKWNFNKCEKYSIFVSQSHYPLKGFHQLLKAVLLVKKFYPQIRVYVAGKDFVNKQPYLRTGYANYLKKFIKRNNLATNVIFLGPLNEKDMIKQYKQSHIFVCPSIIENSSNSISEAQILGVPCIAAYVGGNMDLINNNIDGLLYRYEEIQLLALHICKLFENDKLCLELSRASNAVALIRHNPKQNSVQLFEIYKNILNYD